MIKDQIICKKDKLTLSDLRILVKYMEKNKKEADYVKFVSKSNVKRFFDLFRA